MVKGAATVYVRVVRGGGAATLLRIDYWPRVEGIQHYGKLGSWDISADRPLSTTCYMRGADAVPKQGWYEFNFWLAGLLWYEMTVLR